MDPDHSTGIPIIVKSGIVAVLQYRWYYILNNSTRRRTVSWNIVGSTTDKANVQHAQITILAGMIAAERLSINLEEAMWETTSAIVATEKEVCTVKFRERRYYVMEGIVVEPGMGYECLIIPGTE